MSGFVFFDGKSQINNGKVVGIITLQSHNTKTGPMIQSWILPKNISPVDACRQGKDECICGQCIHRGDKARKVTRTCYVRLDTAPSSVWKAYKRNRYPLFYNSVVDLSDRMLRIGTFGDPAAIPFTVWQCLLDSSGIKKYTGYTSLWSKPFAVDFKVLCMASVSCVAERAQACELGWRTFRVVPKYDSSQLLAGEKWCNALDGETQCTRCLRCRGSKSRCSIVIPVHGIGKSAFAAKSDLRQRTHDPRKKNFS